MRRFRSDALVISRTNFGEADRILTFLTPNHGKVRGIAKGVRKPKSKLAGGIELFSVCDLLFGVGKSEIYTVVSTRLKEHYGNITKDIDRVNSAYEFIRLINKSTADSPESAYYELLKSGLAALNDLELEPQITALWFNMQLLKLSGHAPNLRTDASGQKLAASASYNFHLDRMRFTPEKNRQGSYSANHIKFMRVGFDAAKPQILSKIQNCEKIAKTTEPLVQSMLNTFVQI
ncbi:MAG TPA: DNA repair protein RecO [Nitrososphaera sp.]|jgi:DNA repair protein RecO (recombination protein O)|nr:DNA repair protein RecO [Nitrososphaera sp.]